jgi:hypothetical protein
MSDLDVAEPLEENGPPSLELFMTVVRVAEWSKMVRWYLDTLGLASVLVDPENEFALLAAGQGRLGVAVTEPFNNTGEGYREVRLRDPDGNSLTLFAWIDRDRESQFDREGR